MILGKHRFFYTKKPSLVAILDKMTNESLEKPSAALHDLTDKYSEEEVQQLIEPETEDQKLLKQITEAIGWFPKDQKEELLKVLLKGKK